MNESGWVSCEMSSLVSPRKSSGPDRKVSGDFWYKTDSEYLHHLLQSQATNQQLPLVRRKEGLAALLVAIYFFKIMQLHSPVFSIENMQRLCYAAYLEAQSLSEQKCIKENAGLPQPGQPAEDPKAVVGAVHHLLRVVPLILHLRHDLVLVWVAALMKEIVSSF